MKMPLDELMYRFNNRNILELNLETQSRSKEYSDNFYAT